MNMLSEVHVSDIMMTQMIIMAMNYELCTLLQGATLDNPYIVCIKILSNFSCYLKQTKSTKFTTPICLYCEFIAIVHACSVT
jgi:hypothetical protein